MQAKYDLIKTLKRKEVANMFLNFVNVEMKDKNADNYVYSTVPSLTRIF